VRGDEAVAAILLLLFGLAFLALAWRLVRRRRPGDDQAWATVSLVLAVGIIVTATLLASGREESLQLKLLPFANLIDAFTGNGSIRGSLAEMAANVVLFIPLGMALSWRFPSLGVTRVAVAALVVSVVVEVLQAISQSGRWASTTDLMMNTLGGTIGALATGIGRPATADE